MGGTRDTGGTGDAGGKQAGSRAGHGQDTGGTRAGPQSAGIRAARQVAIRKASRRVEAAIAKVGLGEERLLNGSVEERAVLHLQQVDVHDRRPEREQRRGNMGGKLACMSTKRNSTDVNDN